MKTLADHLDQLPMKERAVIIFALNMSKIMSSEVHHGTLPFIPVETCIQAFNAVDDNPTSRVSWRLWQSTRKKLNKFRYEVGPTAQAYSLYLDPVLVSKKFGQQFKLGVPVKVLFKQRVTAGLKWSLPKKTYVPDEDVLVYPTIRLEFTNDKMKFGNKFLRKCVITSQRKIGAAVLDHLANTCR